MQGEGENSEGRIRVADREMEMLTCTDVMKRRVQRSPKEKKKHSKHTHTHTQTHKHTLSHTHTHTHRLTKQLFSLEFFLIYLNVCTVVWFL